MWSDFLSKMQCIVSKSWNFLTVIDPGTAFLVVLVSFEAVIVSFLIPLTFDVTSKISDRYSSDVVSKAFYDFRPIKILPAILITHIAIIVTILFFKNDEPSSVAYRISSWFIFVTATYIMWLVYKVLTRIRKYLVNTNALMEIFYEEIKRSTD